MKKTPLILAAETAINPEHWSLPDQVASVEGLVGKACKQFLNTLVKQPCVHRYLEIGSWEGSSAIAALWGNADRLKQYWLVDNWSEWFFDAKRNGAAGFARNWAQHMGTTPPNMINADSFALDPVAAGISQVDVYFYDGGHTEQQQYNALTHYLPCMNSQFVYVVDDWKWEEVRNGTTRAIADLGLEVLWYQERRGDDQVISQGWHNGNAMFVLQKQN